MIHCDARRIDLSTSAIRILSVTPFETAGRRLLRYAAAFSFMYAKPDRLQMHLQKPYKRRGRP